MNNISTLRAPGTPGAQPAAAAGPMATGRAWLESHQTPLMVVAVVVVALYAWQKFEAGKGNG